MLLIILLVVLVFGGLTIREKIRYSGSWADATANTWQRNVLDNQAWILWACGVFALGLLRVLFADSFSHAGYAIQAVTGSLFTGIVYIALFVGVIWLIIRLFRSNRGPAGRDTSYGSAEWTAVSILRRFGITTPPKLRKRFLYTGALYYNVMVGHLLTVAGSRSGKSAALLLGNLLLENQDSFLVNDSKGELAYQTAKYQKSLGKKVMILDPWHEQRRLKATHGIPASSFNPLDFLGANSDELSDGCSLIADMLVPVNTETKEPYFDNSARAMIKCYLLHLMTDRPVEEQNLWTIYQWLRLSGDERIDLWAEMRTNDALDGLVRLSVGEFTHFGSDSNTLASVVSTAQDATRFLESKHLRDTLCKSGFQPYDLTKGSMTVYVILPERYLKTHARFLRLVIGLCLRACNHRPQECVNFLLDESFVIGKIDDIEAGYGFAAGQNIRIWSFFQNLNQVKKLYGEEGLSAFTGCQHSMYFSTDCQFTAEYVSKALGDTTIVVSNHSNSSGKEGSTRTNSFSKTGRALMTADEVSKSEEIINFYRQDKTRFKYRVPLWRFFEKSPNTGIDGFDPANDPFERQRLEFMERIDVMPQHRTKQEQAESVSKTTPLGDSVTAYN